MRGESDNALATDRRKERQVERFRLQHGAFGPDCGVTSCVGVGKIRSVACKQDLRVL